MRRTPLLVLRGGGHGRHGAGRHRAGAMRRTVSDTQQPDYTALLTDFTNYYQPDLTAPSTELRGRVVNAEVLKENSDATVSVNHKANEGADQ